MQRCLCSTANFALASKLSMRLAWPCGTCSSGARTRVMQQRSVMVRCNPGGQKEPPLYTKFSNPVYSLSTEPGPGKQAEAASSQDSAAVQVDRPTLNLITYAGAVAIKPDRCFALSLYLGTQSYKNFKTNKRGVLQILCREHASLFNILGKTSAKDVDKLEMIRQAGFSLTEHYGMPTISGDHDVVLCKVNNYSNLADNADQVLYTEYLREIGLMS